MGNDISAIVARAQRARTLGATGELRGELRLLEVDALLWVGSYTEISTLAEESLDRLPKGSPLWFEAAARECESALHTGRPKTIESLAGRALDFATTTGQARPSHVALLRMGTACLGCGRIELGRRLGVPAEGAAPGDAFERGWWHHFRASFALHDGDLGDAMEGATRSKAHFEQAGGAGRALDSLAFLASIETLLGAYASAQALWQNVISLSDTAGRFGLSALARHHLGLVLGRLGRLEEAFVVESDARVALEALGDRRVAARCHTYLALLHQLAGSLDEAVAAAETAESASREMGPLHAFALAVLADAQLARARRGAAVQTAQRAMEEMKSFGGVPEGEGLLRLVHARALLASGEEAAARSAVAEAQTRLLARADKIGDSALRRSFLEDVPENAHTLELTEARPRG
jgi:tetratricopeptide (TPR) repeat protein